MRIRKINAVIAALIAIAIPTIIFAGPLSKDVPPDGVIAVPKNYDTEWVLLGTWSIADKEKAGAEGFHVVYTQPKTVAYFRENGEFPDGAILVKELRKTNTTQLTTGTVSWGSEITGWFVMIKDKKGRFTDNPLWGDGWGWAYFNFGKPNKTTTQNYRTECIGCHIPAKGDDWIYVRGYPILTRK